MDYVTLSNAILTFIIMLYGEPTFPRKIVDLVISFLDDFIKRKFLNSLENSIIEIIDKSKSKHEMKVRIGECIARHKNILENFSTEPKRFDLMKNIGFIIPEQFEITKTYVEQYVDNKTVFVEKSIYGVQVPLRHTVKRFLNMPGLATKIINRVKKYSQHTNVVSNIMQGIYWRTNFIRNGANEYLLPLFLHSDEVETGNALGSHSGANKFLVVYASIACLPANIASRLSSILFSTLIRAEDMKNCSNKLVFKNLIKELKFLRSTGIEIVVNNTKITFKFQLALILGDNLGLNAICGFVQSFKANFYCRMCRADSFICSQLCVENKDLLRNLSKETCY